MERIFVIAGSLLAFVGIALGAFASHGLRSVLEPQALATFEIGVRYQMYHALALIALAPLHMRWPVRLLRAAGVLFFTGTLLFSGSLYLLAFGAPRALAFVAPFGGAAMIAGWLAFAFAAWSRLRS